MHYAVLEHIIKFRWVVIGRPFSHVEDAEAYIAEREALGYKYEHKIRRVWST